MKKALYLLIATLLLATSAQAQLTHKGVRFGLGPAYVTDDFLTSSPIMGGTLGVFANYGFENARSFWADNLYLQFGFNFARRGTNFEQVLEDIRSYRHGYQHNYYAEIPVLACWRYELPIAQPNHVVNFYIGPVFSVGMFGRFFDRCVTPGYPQTSMNYDTYLSTDPHDRRSFLFHNTHVRWFDVSSQIGLGYSHQNWGVDLIWQHGFIPLMNETDVLRNLQNSQTGTVTGPDGEPVEIKPDNRNAYTGTNQSFILSVSYILPWD